jgi:hypothetical protein
MLDLLHWASLSCKGVLYLYYVHFVPQYFLNNSEKKNIVEYFNAQQLHTKTPR